jgi:cytochrome P450
MSDLYWDPFTPELREDPYPLWKRLRDEAPVYYNEPHDFFALTRFHDIARANQDVATFSSGHGTTLETMSTHPNDSGAMIIHLDPPRHTMLRKLVSRSFTTRRIAQLEDRIRAMCSRLLDPQVGAGRFDYVQDFSAILPPTVISSVLGVPEADQEHLRHLVDDVFYIEEGSLGMANPRAQNALLGLAEYLGGQFAERRTQPRDDMFTELVEVEITDDGGDRRRLADGELVEFGILLFAAGSETVARHLGWAASVLDQYPGQRAQLATDFTLIPNAVDEILRFEPPSPVNARWIESEVTLHDVTIPADSRVVLVTGSAGRDERKYANPDVLDIHRKVDLHLTFGYGIHFCLGAALARTESRIGLEETFKRWPDWKVDRDKMVLLYTSTVRGPIQLPIEV